MVRRQRMRLVCNVLLNHQLGTNRKSFLIYKMVSEIQLMSNEKRIYLISTISNYIISSMRQRARERIAQFLFRVFNRLFTQLNIIINWYLFSSVFDLTNHINFTEIHHVEISSWSTDQRTKTWCTLIFLIAVIYIVQLYWQDICICSLQGSYTHVGICSRFSSFFLFLSSLTKKSLSRSRCLRVINNDNWKLLPKKNILASLLFFCSWTHI